MPLFYQQDFNEHTRLAVWKIEEPEEFFLQQVPMPIGINHPHKRLQHLAGRYLLTFLFPGFPYSDILIADTRKPYLPNEAYHFSISHCGHFAAAIVSKSSRVGIDVEQVSPRVERIRHKFLHSSEIRFVNTQPQSLHQQLLTVMWSAKEAMFKWYSYGEIDFSEMMRVFPFQLLEDNTIHASFDKPDLQQTLHLHYQLFAGLCLVYVVS